MRRDNTNGRWGESKNFTFLGFIYNPAVTDEPEPEAVFHTVVKGDKLAIIAKNYKTTVKAIMALNPIITDPNLIRVGWRLRVK